MQHTPKKTQSKKKLLCTIECPECTKIIDVFEEKEVLCEPVQGEYKRKYYAEKSVQTTLSVSQT